MNNLSGTAEKTMEIFFRRNRKIDCPYEREQVGKIMELMDIYQNSKKRKNKKCRRCPNGRRSH